MDGKLSTIYSAGCLDSSGTDTSGTDCSSNTDTSGTDCSSNTYTPYYTIYKVTNYLIN